MVDVYVKRDNGNIVGWSKRSRPNHTEAIDDQDPEFVAFKDSRDNPPDNRPGKGNSQAGGLPALRDDINAIWDVLEAAGIVKP